jgi:hypothetical protein
MTVTPAKRLRDHQMVRVSATGFTPHEALQVIECADKAAATGPSDCNLVGMQAATADAAGRVSARVAVTRGPFGGNNVTCSSEQRCLVSVSQATLTPTEEAHGEIEFIED